MTAEQPRSNLYRIEPETAGQIHGVISRDQAAQMWRPYGERVVLNGQLDLDNITPMEAVQVAYGSDKEAQNAIYYYAYEAKPSENARWLETVAKAVVEGVSEKETMLDWIYVSNEIQNEVIARKRRLAIDNGLRFVGQVENAAKQLAKDGFWDRKQLEVIHQHLYGSDGQPLMQYTPMTQLEFARLAVETDGEEPDLSGSACTDFSLGIIRCTANQRPIDKKIARYIKPHEVVHGGIVGTEIFDITRVDGWRRPVGTVVGNAAFEPSVEIGVGDDFSATRNVEMDEGWVDYVAQALMNTNRRQPLPASQNSHTPFVKLMAKIHADEPRVFKEITRAALVDATPENPDAKREALIRMHEVADKTFGMPDALNTMFRSERSILDIYTKGKKS